MVKQRPQRKPTAGAQDTHKKPTAAKRRRGRPTDSGFQPTKDHRGMVEILAGMGVPQDELVTAIINPATRRPIAPRTLRRHFREELDTGISKVKAKVAVNLLALSGKNAAVAIFLGKVRLGLKEVHHHKLDGALTLEQLVMGSGIATAPKKAR